MEFQKITNLLGITSAYKELPRYVTKTWIEVYDQSEKNYNVNKEIRFETSMLRSYLCDLRGKEILLLVKKHLLLMIFKNLIIQQLLQLLLIMQIIMHLAKKKIFFLNNAPFIKCISKINGTKIDNADDLDVVMPIYNLLEYSKNYKKNNRKPVELL